MSEVSERLAEAWNSGYFAALLDISADTDTANPYRDAEWEPDTPQIALPQGPRSDEQGQGGVVAHPSPERPSEQYDSE